MFVRKLSACALCALYPTRICSLESTLAHSVGFTKPFVPERMQEFGESRFFLEIDTVCIFGVVFLESTCERDVTTFAIASVESWLHVLGV